MRQARLLSTRNTQHHSQVADVPPPPGDTGTPRRHPDVSIEITTSADAAPAANQVDYVIDSSAAVSNSKDLQALKSDLERRSESADTVGELAVAGRHHPQRGHPLVCSSIWHSETLQALSEMGSFKDAEVVSSGTMSWVRRRFTRISCRRRALGAAMKVGGGCFAMVCLDLQDTIEDC